METKRPMWPDLKKKKEEEGSSRTKCRQAVLLTTGSFNPITRAHVEILEIAKRSLEKDFGYVVTNGFISPTHDDYVKDKCIRKKCKFVSSKKRAHMCDLALKNNEWIRTSYWECTCFFQSYYNDKKNTNIHTGTRKRFYDYTGVIRALRKHLDSIGMNDVAVLYVCGSDHARFCSGGFGAKGKGLVVVPREGKPEHKTSDEHMVYGVSSSYVKEMKTTDISSTLVRKVLKMKPVPMDKLNELLDKNVSQYIIDNKLY